MFKAYSYVIFYYLYWPSQLYGGKRKVVIVVILKRKRDFPGGAVVENLPANEADTGLSPVPGRSHMPQSN